jgi:hypothetical protein
MGLRIAVARRLIMLSAWFAERAIEIAPEIVAKRAQSNANRDFANTI